jgi:hypothetical protein
MLCPPALQCVCLCTYMQCVSLQPYLPHQAMPNGHPTVPLAPSVAVPALAHVLLVWFTIGLHRQRLAHQWGSLVPPVVAVLVRYCLSLVMTRH